MEKEVLGLVEGACKYSATEAGEYRCIKALYKLRSLPVPNQVFFSTNVGNSIDSLTDHPTKEIKVLASSILTKWKRQLYRPIKKPNLQTEKVVRNQKPPIKKPDSVPRTNNPMRNKIREEIFQALCTAMAETKKGDIRPQSDPVEVAVGLEAALFRNWGPSNAKNSNKYRSLLSNLKDPKNPDYRKKVLTGEMKAERVASLSALDMAIPITDQKPELPFGISSSTTAFISN